MDTFKMSHAKNFCFFISLLCGIGSMAVSVLCIALLTPEGEIWKIAGCFVLAIALLYTSVKALPHFSAFRGL